MPDTEYLDAVIAAVGNVDIAVFTDDDAVQIGKFTGLHAFLSPGTNKHTRLIEQLHPVVSRVTDIESTGIVKGHVNRAPKLAGAGSLAADCGEILPTQIE